MRRLVLIAAAVAATAAGASGPAARSESGRATTAGASGPAARSEDGRATTAGASGTAARSDRASRTTAARQAAPPPTPYAAALHLTRTIGPRPSASAGELRAHRYAAAAFRAAGLRVAYERFRVPGRGRSRDVVGAIDTPADCLTILMGHADTGPGLPGANDNASGAGTVVALASRLARAATGGALPCDTWLVVTGSEERFVTGRPDHLGAQALVRRVAREGRRADLRIALSLDEVGRGRRFSLQSPHPRPRATVEGLVLEAATAAGARVRFARDTSTGNSDHREFELAGLPGAKLGPWQGVEPCRHRICDTWRRLDRRTLTQAAAIAEGVARTAP
jgi:aminopeptidase YwaD